MFQRLFCEIFANGKLACFGPFGANSRMEQRWDKQPHDGRVALAQSTVNVLPLSALNCGRSRADDWVFRGFPFPGA